MCKDTVHVGAEAVTSEPERGDDSPEAAWLISHPSLTALAPPENHLSTEPLQQRGQAVGLYACQLPE